MSSSCSKSRENAGWKAACSDMKKISRLFVLFFVVIVFSPAASQERKAAFPARDFASVRPLLCDSETMDELKAAGRKCELNEFTVRAEDLNEDGTPEWLFYGPSGVCGAHGNCPLNIVASQRSKYVLLGKGCNGENCLGLGNAVGSEVLKSTHNGYRDLQIATDAGSFYWSKNVYQWDGTAYKALKGSTTYYLYEQTADRLRKVTKERWDACMKGGKRCF